ncbi:MAG: DUF2269 family protein [Bacteroidetes bacterium]|nr:DUF2269 family protein [Bacteroidota bacterium]
MFFQLGLFFHIMGVIALSGSTISNMVVQNIFWKNVDEPAEFRKKFIPMMVALPIVIVVSMILQLLSGLIMLSTVQWAFVNQRWFIIKIILYVIGFLNGIFIAKPTNKKIVQEVSSSNTDKKLLAALKKKMTLFHFVQYTLLILLIVMAIFKVR